MSPETLKGLDILGVFVTRNTLQWASAPWYLNYRMWERLSSQRQRLLGSGDVIGKGSKLVEF